MSNEPFSSNSQTDWQRLDAITDQDIDLSDCPEITPELFAKAVVLRGLPAAKNKAQVKVLLINNNRKYAIDNVGDDKLKVQL